MENTIDYLVPEQQYVKASLTKRLINFFIDNFLFYMIAFVMMGFAIATEANADVTYEDSFYEELFFQIFWYIGYALFMGLIEYFSKGRSVGKFITNTRVESTKNETLSLKSYLLRGLCRLVPFEPFSALGGNPWHDKWTNTMVIDIQKTKAANEIF